MEEEKVVEVEETPVATEEVKEEVVETTEEVASEELEAK